MAMVRDKSIDNLMEGILTLKTVDECYMFFKDLCTIREIKSMAQRVEVAQLLTDKRVYNEIVSETGASTATISRVNRALNDGSDGYAMVLDRLKDQK